MEKNIVITVPNLNAPGGVSAFWNALLPEFKITKEINVIPLEIGGYGKNIFGPFMDQWKFKRIVNDSTDLVLLNPSLGFRSFIRDGFFAKQLAKKNKPFMVFFHGWDLDFENKIDQKYVNFFRTSFGKASKIFVLSQAFKQKLINWGYTGEVIVETTNVNANLLKGFSLDNKFGKQEIESSIKVLFLSRLFKEKGIFETIDAFIELNEKYKNIELTITGDGSDYAQIEQHIAGIKNIVMTGHVEGEEKIKLFTQHQIYCLPSYSEGLPTSVLEAMAFGLPIITTPVGGLADFFHDGKMGYFVQPRNKKEIVERLESLISNKALIKKMGAYNHDYALNNVLNTKLAERLIKQINTAIH